MLLAGAGGALVRFGLERLLDRRPGLPWAVLTVNVLGSVLLGAVLVLVADERLPHGALAIVGTGFCGALTTFSGFSMAAVRVGEHSNMRAVLFVAATVLTCALGAAAGGAVAGVR